MFLQIFLCEEGLEAKRGGDTGDTDTAPSGSSEGEILQKQFAAIIPHIKAKCCWHQTEEQRTRVICWEKGTNPTFLLKKITIFPVKHMEKQLLHQKGFVQS